MSELDSLLTAVRQAEQSGDPDAVDAARAAYLETNPSGPDAADVRFRHGISTLLRHHNAEAAMALFKAAASEKGADIAPEARIAYASVLFNRNKQKQAIFELRKLLPQGASPSVHTVGALDFLAMFMRDSGAPEADVNKVQAQRFEHIEALAQAASNPEERAHWLFRLGTAYADGSEPGDVGKARARFSEVVKMGQKAGAETLKMARAAIKSLPR